MKKIITLILAVSMLICMAVTVSADSITVIVNGCEVESDVPADIINGRTMLPVRAICEAMGMRVKWDESARSVTGMGYDFTITMQIDNPEARFYLETEPTESSTYTAMKCDVPPQIVNGRTMLPVRAIADLLGASVNWDEGTKTVTIEGDIFPDMTDDGGYKITPLSARFIGRYYENDGLFYSSYTAAGIELRFRGTEAKLAMNVCRGSELYEAYVHIFVDGDETLYNESEKDNRVLLPKGESTVTLASGLSDGIHTVKILKANEDASNQIGWKAFYSDGELLAPPIPKSRKIQVFGDSITCANNNMDFSDNNDGSLGSRYQDGLLSYASFIGRYFNADTEIVAKSGLSCYNAYNGNSDMTYYDMVAAFSGHRDAWDHSLFEPQLIIQFNWINDCVGKIERDGIKPEAVKNCYVSMLKDFHAKHPNAKIIIMSNACRPVFTELATQAVAEFEAGGGTGAMVFVSEIPYPRHPFAETHQKIAEELEPVIASLMGW